MLRLTRTARRGFYDPDMGFVPQHSPRRIGGTPRIHPVFTDFLYQSPERPVRADPEAVKKDAKLLPVLYHRQDQLMELHNALAETRRKNQVRNAMNQLNLAVRNVDVYIKDIVMKDKIGRRPHIHDMVFQPGGLSDRQHILSCLPTHQMIPILSLISYDFESKRITLAEVEQVVQALADSTVGHSKAVQRELFNQYIRCCALDENSGKAVAAVREMKNKGIRRNHVTYAPLFRLARKKMDADFHIALTDLASDVEGGMLKKLVRIDIPRFFSVFLVIVRFWWMQIVTVLLVAGGLCSAILLAWLGLA